MNPLGLRLITHEAGLRQRRGLSMPLPRECLPSALRADLSKDPAPLGN